VALSIIAALTALLTDAPDLQAAIGGAPYAVYPTAVWHLPNDVGAPALALAFEGRDSPIDELSAPETLTLRCWFLANTQWDAHAFRDALRAKLAHQQFVLRTHGIMVDYIACTAWHVGIAPETGRPQAYAAFSIVA